MVNFLKGSKTDAVTDEHHEKNQSALVGEDGGLVDRARLEKRLIRKLDIRFSILVVIYILNYIDRNNVSAARTKGFEDDLSLTGSQYPTVLSILYVGYLLMQIPSNMIVQYTGRPSIYLPVCIILWGMISMCMAVVHEYIGALMVRFFLGFVEAAFFPGALFCLSKWYRKEEYGVRTTVLYCGSLISNAFGPLIAAGILGGMEGIRGYRAWEWLFLIEGAATIFFGFVTMLVLPDFPHNTRGLSNEERSLAELRMTEDFGGKDEDTTTPMQAVVAVLTDYKAWVMALSLTSMVVSLSFNQFFPTLTRTLGYSNTVSLLLCAPPFFFATIVAFVVSRHSDKTGERYFHIMGPLCLGIVGFIIAMSTQVLAARYVALFLMAQSYAGFVCLYAWIPTTFPRPAMKRAIAIAFINAFSQLGNVAGAYIFPSAWGPSYLKSYGICISCFVVCMCGITFHRFTLQRLNKKLDAQDAAGEVNVLSGVEFPRGFRYVL
ncbi:MFS general substrate transporter [Leucosporidium creatinivorum]|uniref:MFS general substrate transporter n=1 Tax=Leucosporidium creatinivorum TaxID=106004 RepID=A0A1Y2G1G9_9BASI|nr:MFS general substrate transporter [Leucosporidium creatinivorum]